MRPLRATYRLQLRREFGFADAAAIALYLAELGVSHVYASPYLRARPGSTHGYDIVAHDELNPELGGEAGFEQLHAALSAVGLGQILDFVPNHMGVGGADNPLWLDVLEWGPDSPFAGWFDIDWEPAARYLTEKLLVPVLDDQYGAVLEAGKLQLKVDADRGEFAVWAYDAHKLPVSPLHYARILGNEHPALERLGDAFSSLAEWRPQIRRQTQELKQQLAATLAADGTAAQYVYRRLERFNGSLDATRSELDALIQQQYWRASHFRVAGDDINYRRFFNINDLAGVRIELAEVFEHAHRLVVRLLREGRVDGLRIDHIDGLLDPRQYLVRLRELGVAPEGAQRPFHVLVEKILAHDERLPADWPVEGTTGYEFANQVLRLLTDARGEAGLTRAWQQHVGGPSDFGAVVRDSKIFIMKNEMASELNVLARDAARVARQNARTADFTRRILHRALRATIACFPVYRTYLDAEGALSGDDRARILAALSAARELERDLDPSVFDFLEHLLTGALVSAPRSGYSRQAALRCAMKFQQLSGPVMAKGLEDTAFYRYNRLISHNEVGGDPQRLGCSLEEFHALNLERARVAPCAMLSTSTHDTKRGEDVRARLAALAEVPEEWSAAVARWRRCLAVPAAALDDPSLEYFFYQTLLGSYPADGLTADYRQRLKAALQKSAREARQRTSWARPNQHFEGQLDALVDAALDSVEFRREFEPFQARIALAGVANSLLQTVLKLTLPGIPDLYQGTEGWDLSLVDPDNRRPVDYTSRGVRLARLLSQWQQDPARVVREALRDWQDGNIKLLIIALLLRLRSSHQELFQDAYVPGELRASDDSVGAFLRESANASLLVAFARYPMARQRDAASASCRVVLPRRMGPWRDVLTGQRAPRAAELALEIGPQLPVIVLLADTSSDS